MINNNEYYDLKKLFASAIFNVGFSSILIDNFYVGLYKIYGSQLSSYQFVDDRKGFYVQLSNTATSDDELNVKRIFYQALEDTILQNTMVQNLLYSINKDITIYYINLIRAHKIIDIFPIMNMTTNASANTKVFGIMII